MNNRRRTPHSSWLSQIAADLRC
ncbi:MAG: hypothetical protein H6Q40_721, partial [Deltaproteobacteria bacterium]|nr:hypothetical protein [Deltaproteobacteria bacterium]